MKIKVEFCEYWFRTKDGNTVYKIHFKLSDDVTAYVASTQKYLAGDEIILTLSRDNDGRCKVVIKR